MNEPISDRLSVQKTSSPSSRGSSSSAAETEWDKLEHREEIAGFCLPTAHHCFLAGFEASETRHREVVEAALEAEKVLTKNFTAWLTIQPTLDHPYPDDPRWTPWTRWGERAARSAHDTAMKLRAALASYQRTPAFRGLCAHCGHGGINHGGMDDECFVPGCGCQRYDRYQQKENQ